MAVSRNSLFPPEGFCYESAAISKEEELFLVERIRELPLREFDFHGYKGKRRVISFGWRYDFAAASLDEADPIPDFLDTAREYAAGIAGITAADLVHVLITEYQPGTVIGWHRDKAVFGDVIGLSLFSDCKFRFRLKIGSNWERHTVGLDPRSLYLLRGPSRTDWEHSISPVGSLRYSITFRTLRMP